jgi:excisionase family DNA binding protein
MPKSVTGDPTIKQAADETTTSTKFIRARIASGDLKAYRLKGSRLIRIERASLDALKVPTGGAA